MSLISVVIIAISLSMDAFSLSLVYGTLNMKKSDIKILSFIVGIYHFLMPLIGMYIGKIILQIFPLNPNIIVFIVLTFIGIQMIFESFRENTTIKLMNIKEYIFFGLAVSLDSFSVGIGLRAIYNYPIISALLFSISSLIFTYLGLNLGKTINKAIGKISTLLGGLCLVIIGISYLI